MKLTRREFLGLASALGLGWHFRAAAQANTAKRFSIAAINDLHIVDAPSTGLLQRAVAQINALTEVQFAVVLGDLSQDCTREQFELAQKALNRLARPYKAVPGNHDVIGDKGLAYSEYVRAFQERNWVRQVQNWFFIGLDSCTRNAADVQIPLVRIAWINEQLQKIPGDRPIALFAHHPFNPHAYQHHVRNADKVIALFSKHRLRLVACGHWHGNQVEIQDGVLYTTTACCSSARGNHDFTPTKGFRLFHFTGEQVETEFVPVEMPRED